MSEESAIALNYLKFQNVQNLTVSKLYTCSLSHVTSIISDDSYVACAKRELSFHELTHLIVLSICLPVAIIHSHKLKLKR